MPAEYNNMSLMATEGSLEKEVNPLLSEDPFKSEQSQKLFEAIDELRTCGANHEVDLPELVIVGDQSVGKSSLLQSLTDIPFPVGGRLCTRFPTLILSRRTPNKPEITRISIDAVESTSFKAEPLPVRIKRYASFTRQSSHITAAKFVDIVQEAADLMGITSASASLDEQRGPSSTIEAKNFSDDVLKIEISGPSRSYFSIIDVPGVFQSLTKDLTEKEKAGVMNMVTSYMRRQQSIIICIASATNDLANQTVFDMASTHDPKGMRTVGVITKCDIAQDKDQVLELAQNKEKHFNHGWFVVRNRTPADIEEGLKPLGRHMKEKDFFDARPWDRLPESRRGTQPLKKYLAALLCSRIEANFPSILSTIKARQTSVRSTLDLMGTPRKTIEQKRVYLTSIAQQLHSSAFQALRGRYDIVPTTELRLRTKVRELNDDFALDMKTWGHSAPFVEIPMGKNIQNTSSHGPGLNFDLTKSTKPQSVQPNSNGGIFGGFGSSKVGFQNYRFSTSPFEACPQLETPEKTLVYQSITFMKPYRNRSFEEIRLSDYLQVESNLATPSYPSNAAPTAIPGTPSGGSLFGATPSYPSNATSAVLPGTSSGGSLFGAIPSIPKNSASNPFGSTPSGSLFGKGQETPSIGAHGAFGSPGSVFGSSTAVSSPNQKAQVSATPLGSQIYQWIRHEVKASRGTELQGTLNPDVLPVLFHKQAGKWRLKSEAHFLRIQKTTMSVTEKLAEAACGDEHTRAQIRTLIHQADKQATSHWISELTKRLNDILSEHLQTNNPEFEDKISEARLLRFQAALERYRASKNSQPASLFGGSATDVSDSRLIIDMQDTAALFAELHMSNSRNLEDEIHDTLKSYYEIALNEFIEYVTKLIVERYLNDPKGPLLVFSPIYVGGLDDQAVERLAAEDDSTMRLRAETEQTLALLNRAEEIALKYS